MVLDLEIIQGSTFEFLALIKDVNDLPLDMDTFTPVPAGARGMIRKKYSDAQEIVEFDIAVMNKNNIVAEEALGGIHLTTAEIDALEPATSGKCYLLITLSATATAGIPKGNYVYDIEIEDLTGFVFKPFSGNVSVLPEATK